MDSHRFFGAALAALVVFACALIVISRNDHKKQQPIITTAATWKLRVVDSTSKEVRDTYRKQEVLVYIYPIDKKVDILIDNKPPDLWCQVEIHQDGIERGIADWKGLTQKKVTLPLTGMKPGLVTVRIYNTEKGFDQTIFIKFKDHQSAIRSRYYAVARPHGGELHCFNNWKVSKNQRVI